MLAEASITLHELAGLIDWGVILLAGGFLVRLGSAIISWRWQARVEAQLKTLTEQTQDLHEWHNNKDADGRYSWYTPTGLAGTVMEGVRAGSKENVDGLKVHMDRVERQCEGIQRGVAELNTMVTIAAWKVKGDKND